MTRIVFLPPFPANAVPFQTFEAVFRRTTIERLKKLLSYYCREKSCEFVSYIRHEATVRLLSEALGIQLKPSSDLYKYQSGDYIILVGLRKPQRGTEVSDIKTDDLDIMLVDIFDINIRRTFLEEMAFKVCTHTCYEPRREEIKKTVPADQWVNAMSKAFADCVKLCEDELK